MKKLLPKLTERLVQHHSSASKIQVPKYTSPLPKEDNDKISHAWFWPRVGAFFKPKDVIVTETGMLSKEFSANRTILICVMTGTSNFGILDVPLPEKSVLLSQVLWGSIGWSVGRSSFILSWFHRPHLSQGARLEQRWLQETWDLEEPSSSSVMAACQ